MTRHSSKTSLVESTYALTTSFFNNETRAAFNMVGKSILRWLFSLDKFLEKVDVLRCRTEMQAETSALSFVQMCERNVASLLRSTLLTSRHLTTSGTYFERVKGGMLKSLRTHFLHRALKASMLPSLSSQRGAPNYAVQ